MKLKPWELPEAYDDNLLIIDQVAILRAVSGECGKGAWITRTEAVFAARAIRDDALSRGRDEAGHNSPYLEWISDSIGCTVTEARTLLATSDKLLDERAISPEVRAEARRQKARERFQREYRNMTPEQRARRNERHRVAGVAMRARMTEEQRKRKRERDQASSQRRRARR